MSHVFISYSKKDVVYVRRLVKMLRDNGFDVWIDDRNLRSSEDWWQSIVLSIRACSSMIIVMTPESDASSWVQREVTLALKYNKPIYPLWLDGSIETPNWLIFVRTQYHDVRGNQLPDEQFLEALMKHTPASEGKGRDVTTTVRIPPVDVEDDEVYREAIENPPAVTSDDSITPRQRVPTWLFGVSIFAVLLVGILFAVNTLSDTVTPEPTPTTGVTQATSTPAPSVSTISVTPITLLELDGSNIVDLLNDWRMSQDPSLQLLANNAILSTLADEQVSYLYNISASELPSIREHLFEGETEILNVASERGYIGDVGIFVETLEEDTTITLGDLIAILERRGVADVHSYYQEIGVSMNSNPVTGLEYVVLILGKPELE
ncbi:MAG: toll/interleukin-1 receptor domain-containing protein [Chloroflexota bacterium]